MSDTLKITPFGIKEVRTQSLIKENDPRLRMKSVPWDFSNQPEDPLELSRQLIDTCKAYGGLGLSAVQIGKMYRVFCIGLMDKFQICFNPEIVSLSLKSSKDVEGCLSFPGLALKVERPVECDVTFQMPDGSVQNQKFHGLTARCFLHELDHLDGVVFSDKVGDMTLMRAKDARRKFIKRIERRRKK